MKSLKTTICLTLMVAILAFVPPIYARGGHGGGGRGGGHSLSQRGGSSGFGGPHVVPSIPHINPYLVPGHGGFISPPRIFRGSGYPYPVYRRGWIYPGYFIWFGAMYSCTSCHGYLYGHCSHLNTY